MIVGLPKLAGVRTNFVCVFAGGPALRKRMELQAHHILNAGPLSTKTHTKFAASAAFWRSKMGKVKRLLYDVQQVPRTITKKEMDVFFDSATNQEIDELLIETLNEKFDDEDDREIHEEQHER